MPGCLAAGGNLTLKAHGAGESSDISARGVEMRAAGDTTLAADGDISLAAAQNRATYEQDSKSQAASIGVSFSFGQRFGWSIDVAASGTKGDADGHQSGWSASSVEAGGTLKLVSGGDTTLQGTQARGERIEAQVGRNLAIESLLGAHDYKSQQVSGGFSASIGFNNSFSDLPPLSWTDMSQMNAASHLVHSCGGAAAVGCAPGNVNPATLFSYAKQQSSDERGQVNNIRGKLSGLYDEQGNIKQGMSPAGRFAYDNLVTTSTFPVAAPFAAAQGLPPEVWQAIAILLKAAR